MNNFSWSSIVAPDGGAIEYENPQFGSEEPWRHEDHLLVSFPSKIHIELCWDYDEDCYVAYFWAGRFSSLLDKRHCNSAIEAIQAVKGFSERAYVLSHKFPDTRMAASPRNHGRVIEMRLVNGFAAAAFAVSLSVSQ